MNKQNIINNWNIYYKSYLDLNPDLATSGIKSKRSALNHFVKYGYDEGRKISLDIQQQQFINNKLDNLFYLDEKMIIEKLNLNI